MNDFLELLDGVNGNTKVYTDNYEWKRLSEARQNDDIVALCAICDKPAKVIDHLFPHHWDRNRCKCHKL